MIDHDGNKGGVLVCCLPKVFLRWDRLLHPVGINTVNASHLGNDSLLVFDKRKHQLPFLLQLGAC